MNFERTTLEISRSFGAIIIILSAVRYCLCPGGIEFQHLATASLIPRTFLHPRAHSPITQVTLGSKHEVNGNDAWNIVKASKRAILGDLGIGQLYLADVIGKKPRLGSRRVKQERSRTPNSSKLERPDAAGPVDVGEMHGLEREGSDSGLHPEERIGEALDKEMRAVAAAKARKAKALVSHLLKKARRLLWKGQLES